MNITQTETTYDEIEQSFKFTNHIERIWFWVRDVRLLIIINNFDFEPIKMIKGQNTFMKGNEFEGKIFNKLHYKSTVMEVESQPFQKSIKWKCVFDNNIKLFLTMALYEVSNTSTTIMYCHTEYEKGIKELFGMDDLKLALTTNCNEMVESIKKVLQDSAINLSQFEAGIIRTSMSALWDIISDFKKVKIIAPLSCFDFEYHYDTIHEGCLSKFITKANNGYLIRVSKINKRDDANEWSFVYELIGGAPKVPFRDTTVSIKKINKSECHISILTEFLVPCNYEALQKISKEKKYLITSIKDYLENYVST